MKYTINSKDSLSSLIGKLRETFTEKKYFQVTINTGKRRTISQNFVSHGWYKQISTEGSEYTPEEVKNLCKYHLGLPILRGDDESFNATCEAIIDPLPYESRIKAMTYLPVTSLMSTVQLSLYLETVQRHYAGRVKLEFDE